MAASQKNVVAPGSITLDKVVIASDQAADGFVVNTDKFTVAAATGNTLVAGTFTASGAAALNGGIAVDTTAFTVADTTGNTAIAGTLTVTGAAAFNGGLACDTNKFTVADTSGNTATAGTLSCAGNFAVNTNKFTVAASSGDTVVAGKVTLTLTNYASNAAAVAGGLTAGMLYQTDGAVMVVTA